MLEYLKFISSLIYDRRARYRLQGYRPGVICLVQSIEQADRFLFISPTQKPNVWMAPQEGIEPNESVEAAVVRGLNAELGIKENQVHFRRSIWLSLEKIPEQRGERDISYSLCKMKGKAYYAGLVMVSEEASIITNAAEVSKYSWLTIEEIKACLLANSERKQRLLRQAFLRLLDIKV